MNSFIIITFLIWRLLLFLFALLGEKLLPFVPSFPYSDVYLLPTKLPSWFWSFANFDGVHYLTIAKSGYSAQFTQVFFPLYPLLIRLLGLAIPANHIIIGLLISNIFFFLSLVIFNRLLLMDYSKDTVRWILLFLLFFPASFFFGSFYTESFFLFLVVFSFYSARKKRWLAAGILGGLASATRLAGIFLLPALIWEWQQNKLKVKSIKLKVKTTNGILIKYYRSALRFTLYALGSPVTYLTPLGLLFYMLYLQLKFGDFLYFWHVQPIFGAERSGSSFILLPQVLWRYLKIFYSIPLHYEVFWISFLEFSSVVFAVIILIFAHFKKIRPSYLVFSWFCVIIPTLTGTFSSMPRYILAAFPIFIVLGMIKNRLFKILLLVSCFLLLASFTILFTRGHFVA